MILSWIARRTLGGARRPLFISLLSGIGVAGTGLGVFSLIVVLSVMNGFEKDFRSRIVGFNGALTISTPDPLTLTLSHKGERGQRAYPIVEAEGILQSEARETMGVKIRGIEQKDFRIDRYFKVNYALGSEIKDLFDRNEPGIIIGQELALALNVHPDFEDRVLLISPLGDVGPSGDFIPRLRQFRVIGIFKSGFYEYDTKFAIVAYPQVLSLFPHSSEKKIVTDGIDFQTAVVMKAKLEKENPSLAGKVTTWQEQNKKLFGALRMERIGMFLLLSMIVLISSVTIFGMLSLIILDKVREMALLRAIGLERGSIRRIFLWQGIGIGLKGTACGGLLGVLVVLLLYFIKIPLPSSYYLDFLPVSPSFSQIGLVLLTAPLLAVVTAFYPAGQASKMEIAPLLRYE
ncbi:MAG: ABC transporter permease [Deltaproteobacteria bacterium]|nr:ABC transporter permease [Deltaproteobacteria bacterium]